MYSESDSRLASEWNRYREEREGRQPEDRLACRLVGDYLSPSRLGDPAFNACDAVAHALLAWQNVRDEVLEPFYLAGYEALVRAFDLPHSAETLKLLAWKTQTRTNPEHKHPALTHPLEFASLGHLLGLRKSAIHFNNAHESINPQVSPSVDLWLQSFDPSWEGTESLAQKPYRGQLRSALEWWWSTSLLTVRGVRLLDEAICALLTWDATRSLPYEEIRRNYGYPDPEPVYESLMDSL